MLVCFSGNNKHRSVWRSWLPPLCVCCDAVASTDLFHLKGSRKLGSHHQISTHVISVGCWLSSIFFIITRQYFQRKRQPHCFVMISGMILQIWKEERISTPSFVLLLDLRGLWSGSFREVYLAKWPRVFPVSAPETSASSRRKHSLGHLSGGDGWCQQWWGGQLRAINTSRAACWVHQKVPELTFTVLKGKNITHPHFNLLTSFKGPVCLLFKWKEKKSLKTNSQNSLELLLFTTRRVPRVSVYTTHIKNNWLINLMKCQFLKSYYLQHIFILKIELQVGYVCWVCVHVWM